MVDDIAGLHSLQPPSDSIQPINTLSISSDLIQPQLTSVSAVNQSSSDGGLGAGSACSGEVKCHPRIYFDNIPEIEGGWYRRYMMSDVWCKFF
jgi:hypothetical protein